MVASLPVFIMSLHTILFDSSCLLCVCLSVHVPHIQKGLT